MQVTTTSGDLGGAAVTGGEHGRQVSYFGGVPYAAAGRFEAPQPFPRWAGVRSATTPGAAAPQRIDGLDLVPGMAPATTSEDCLTAEIWSPALDGDPLPVIVWIPGGSFRIGGASLPTYDGRHLAADGNVVVIGLNYRLGLFGFLAAEGVPSNLGLRDLLAALEWVRANCAAFGGDPARVTLMGESAGAGAIVHLLSDPTFDCAGAIIASGSPTMTQSPTTAGTVAQAVFSAANAHTVDDLRARSVAELLDVQAAVVSGLAASVGMMPFHPWVDGDVVPQAPLQAIASDAFAPVPLVVCTTSEEMELFRTVVPRLPREHALRLLVGKSAPLQLSPEGVALGLAACGDDLVAAIADIDLQVPALRLCEHHARRGLPVWRATFTWATAEHGACHAADLPFHFGTLDVTGWRAFADANQPAADRLSRRMREAWASFAAEGQPECAPIGTWPRYDAAESVVELGKEVRVLRDPDAERLRSWT